MRNGRNDVIIVWRLPEESPSFVFKECVCSESIRCWSLKYKSLLYTSSDFQKHSLPPHIAECLSYFCYSGGEWHMSMLLIELREHGN